MSKAKKSKLGYVGKMPGTVARDSDSWYTPESYLKSARTVLGDFELDPFSSLEANNKVKAKRIFTENDDAFKQDWLTTEERTVWMNPPYGKLMAAAVDKFVKEFDAKKFDSAIVLCNNATDTKWFAQLVKSASAMCFTNHRIQFENVDGKNISGNTRGQVFIYFGKNKKAFKNEFCKHGLVLSI